MRKSPGRTGAAITPLRRFFEVMERERRQMLAEFVQVKDLMPLLMKPRNREKWTPEDRRLLIQHLKRMSHLSPYIAVIVMPGGFALLPVLAWWLDRRRTRRVAVVRAD